MARSKVIEKVKTVLRRRPRQMELEEYLAKLQSKGLHPDGTPVLDPTPLAPPIGYKKQPSMVEIVRDMVQRERLAQEAEAAGYETFDESEDFDIGDDFELMPSPWVNEFDPPLAEVAKVVEAEKAKAPKRPPSGQPSKPPAEPADAVPPSDGPDAGNDD